MVQGLRYGVTSKLQSNVRFILGVGYTELTNCCIKMSQHTLDCLSSEFYANSMSQTFIKSQQPYKVALLRGRERTKHITCVDRWGNPEQNGNTQGTA